MSKNREISRQNTEVRNKLQKQTSMQMDKRIQTEKKINCKGKHKNKLQSKDLKTGVTDKEQDSQYPERSNMKVSGEFR